MSVRRQSYPAYKDSGVPWLGDVPNAWEVAKLKSVAAVRLSGVDKKAEEGEIPVRFLSTKEVYNRDLITNDLQLDEATASASEWDAFGLATGDVVLTKDSVVPDNIAIPSYVPEYLENVICGYHLALLRPRRGRLVPKYLFWALTSSSLSQQFYAVVKGITIVGITTLDIRNSLLLVPPTSEQRAIAAFLDGETAKIDTLIRKQERLIGLLEEKRAALITHAVTKGLDPDVSMRDSAIPWLGEIPAHWDVMDLKYALERNDGGVWGDEPDHDGTIVLRSTDMAVGGKWTIDEPALRKLSPAECKGARLRTGDLLVTKSSGSALHLGKTALVTPEVEALRCCFSNFMQRLRPTSRFSSRYLYRVLNSPLGREQFNFLGSTTTGLNNLSQNVIDSVRVPVPGLEEQRAIATFVDRETARIDGLVGKAHRMIERLQEYRTALISAAVTGKIDVREEI